MNVKFLVGILLMYLILIFQGLKTEEVKIGQCYKHNDKIFHELSGIKIITDIYPFTYEYVNNENQRITVRKTTFRKNHTLTKCPTYDIIDNIQKSSLLESVPFSSIN